MKLTKRILAVMLSFLMIMTSANIVVLGAGDPTITLSSATATNGDTVDVTVTMTGNPGIISATLDITYDTSALTLTGVTDSGLLPGQTHRPTYGISPYRLTWANDTAPSNYTVEGVLATLHFTVNEDAAAGDYTITASIPKDGIYNFDTDNVDFALVNGTVTVVEEHAHSMTHYSAVEATCAAAGNVEYWECSGCGLFFADEEGTETIADVVIPADSTNHTGGTEVRDAVEATETTEGYTGDTYCLGCGDKLAEGEVIPATGGGVPEDAAKIVVSNDRGRAGETVEVEISLENNPGFVSMLLGVNYDSEYLTLVDVTDTALIPGATHDLTDLTVQPLTLCWQNWTVTDNITSNGVVAKLTFEVAEDAPADIEISVSVSYDHDNYDITNVDFEPVYFETVPGTITIIDTLYGDVNDDGKVNMVDSGLLARYVARWSGYADKVDMDAADVNADGKVNMIDSGILARHVARWSAYAVLPYGAN